jgi:ribosomal protein S18 acetylase RimI-like enzyme
MERRKSEPSIGFRLAAPDDRGFLADCFLRAMRESITACRGAWDERRERDQFERQLSDGESWIVVLEERAVGFFTLATSAERIVLNTLCISPEHQGAGIGTKVLSHLLAQADARRVPLELSVLRVNARAQALYQRMGFALASESENHVHMRRMAE